MNAKTFRSSLASHLDNFVAFKQLQGFQYLSSSRHLRGFDSFLVEKSFDKSYLTPTVVEEYTRHTERLQPSTRYTRLCLLQRFSRYVHLVEPQSYVLLRVPVKRPNHLRYYLYEDAEIQALMLEARDLTPTSSLRPHTYQTLIGFLFVTGARIDEALSLNLADVRLEDKLLALPKTKFTKARLLPLADSTVQALRSYLQRRHAFGFTADTDPFFLSRFGRRLKYRTVLDSFRNLIQRGRIGADAPDPPRLHDLRHTFATRCLLKWYHEGQDVNAKLPILATYMGHTCIEHTQVYLHITSQLLAEANRRFQHAFELKSQL